MKKFLIALGILALVIPAYGRVLDLWVGDGTGVPDTYDQSTGDSYFEACMELDGDFNVDGYVWLADGTAALPAMFFDTEAGDDSGFYYVANDSFGVSIGGAVNTIWDANGITVIGFDGPIGAVTPAAGIFTTVDGTDATFTGPIDGDDAFNYGPDAGDLHTGYRRTETIKSIDTWSHGNDVHLAAVWDLTQVVGLGTNTVTVVDGWNELVTGGAGGPDMESTRSNGLHQYIAYEPRLECVVDLTAVAAGQTFFFGFWAQATEYAEIIMEPATSVNWLVRVDDTGGATTHDTGILANAGTPTKLEIWVDNAGAVNAAIDDVDVACAGLDPMTANAHYVEWRILDVAGAVHTIAIDYVIQEQLKVQ